METQTAKILGHLERFGSITSLEAINAYGITRLASRISDLRHSGHPIGSEWVTKVNRYGENTRVKKYYLVPENYGIINAAVCGHQITFESISDKTENLRCPKCGEKKVRLISEWSNNKNCYYHHTAECLGCGFKCYPTGVKTVLLETWDETVWGMNKYFQWRYKG